jgi:hypothetical protein
MGTAKRATVSLLFFGAVLVFGFLISKTRRLHGRSPAPHPFRHEF